MLRKATVLNAKNKFDCSEQSPMNAKKHSSVLRNIQIDECYEFIGEC